MKKLIIIGALLVGFFGFSSISVSAQCDLNTASHIRCGFYNEGYQDGIQDAQANRGNDYKRYRSKYSSTNQYEDFYKRGYDAGYQTIRPTVRWTTAQRNAYDAGYSQGQSDRRTAGRGIEGGISGRYDPGIGAFYQQGYDDGFNNRPRQYNVAVGNDPNFPGTGYGTTATWAARVDDRTNIILRGNTIQTQTLSGSTTIVSSQTMNGSLPRYATTVSARKTDGRGEVTVIQQPNQYNDFTSIIQVYDPSRGQDIYRVEISWSGSGSTTLPNAGSNTLRWTGTVEHMAEISLSGRNVQSRDTANLGLNDVDFRLNGQLPRRAVNVTVRQLQGRGQVTVLQQPTLLNNFTAIVQVYDVEAGGDRYVFDLEW